MEDDLNGRQPQWKKSQWKTTPIQEDFNGRLPQWKTTSIENDLYGRCPQWKRTRMEDNMNGRRTQLAQQTNFVLSLAQLSLSLFLLYFDKNRKVIIKYKRCSLLIFPNSHTFFSKSPRFSTIWASFC